MIASKYAKAFITITSDVEVILNELQQLLSIISKPSITTFFASPQISLEAKKGVIKKMFDKKIDPKLLSFLLFLIERRRFQELPQIVRGYSNLALERMGVLKGDLTVAKPLAKGAKEQLQKKLEKIYQKSVQLEEKVDPKLIGGGILRIGTQLADFSIRGKLDELEKDLYKCEVRQ